MRIIFDNSFWRLELYLNIKRWTESSVDNLMNIFSSIVYKNNVDVVNKWWNVSGNTSTAVFSKCTGKKQILFRSIWRISCRLQNISKYLKLLGGSHRFRLKELILYCDVICGNTVLGTVRTIHFVLKLKERWR